MIVGMGSLSVWLMHLLMLIPQIPMELWSALQINVTFLLFRLFGHRIARIVKNDVDAFDINTVSCHDERDRELIKSNIHTMLVDQAWIPADSDMEYALSLFH